MIGALWLRLLVGLLGTGLVVLAVNRFADHYYDRGYADAEAAQARAELEAATDAREADRASLEALAGDMRTWLAEDRAWRTENREQFETAASNIDRALSDTRRLFNASTGCPSDPDDVRVYNEAFGLAPADADPAAGDPER